MITMSNVVSRVIELRGKAKEFRLTGHLLEIQIELSDCECVLKYDMQVSVV